MKVFEDFKFGPILAVPTPLPLRSLLLRTISLRSHSSRTPNGEGQEMPEIVLQPSITGTIEWLTSLLHQTSPSPILLLGDNESFQAMAALEGSDVEGDEGLLNATVRGETPGQSTAAELETSSLRELLTPRELEVLEQLALASTNNQIAELLSITPNTVYTHDRHIKAKLKTSNRTETALLARAMLHESY